VAQRDEPLLKYAGHAGGGMPAPLES
jgi:hypothetical protein